MKTTRRTFLKGLAAAFVAVNVTVAGIRVPKASAILKDTTISDGELARIIRHCWKAGDDVNLIITGPYNKRVISGFAEGMHEHVKTAAIYGQSSVQVHESSWLPGPEQKRAIFMPRRAGKSRAMFEQTAQIALKRADAKGSAAVRQIGKHLLTVGAPRNR